MLTTPPPNPLQMNGSLQNAINAPIAAGTIPGPTADRNTVYLVHGPSNVINEDENGLQLCFQIPDCALHYPGMSGAFTYQVALVPLKCPACGSTLNESTSSGIHELAEAIADLGTATFETADACESDFSQLECCGARYYTQWLDNVGGPNNCTSINPSGAKCGCGIVGTACSDSSACCSGLACQPWVDAPGNAPQTACCFENGRACYGPNDCCGALTCAQGRCTCAPRRAVCRSPSGW